MRVIAHRGANDKAPENTIDAFDAAIADGADAIELDVQATADGVAVIAHDDHLLRVAGIDARISELDVADLAGIDVAATRPGWTRPARIPTLDEVAARIGSRVELFVELKAIVDPVTGYRPSAHVAEIAWPILRTLPRCVVSSFDPSGPAVIQALAEGRIPIAQSVVAVAGIGFLDFAVQAGVSQIHAEVEMIDEDFVARVRAAGLDVLAYTVNDPAHAARLAEIGVAGIFTDVVGAMIAALRGDEHAQR